MRSFLNSWFVARANEDHHHEVIRAMSKWLNFFASLSDKVGEELEPTDWFSLDQQATDVYAALIGDLDPMHNDPTWEGTAQWGGTIVVGTQGLCLLPWLLTQHGFPIDPQTQVYFEPLRVERVRFIASLNVGQRAKARVVVRDVSADAPSVWRVKTEHTIDREHAERPFMHALLEARYTLRSAPS